MSKIVYFPVSAGRDGQRGLVAKRGIGSRLDKEEDYDVGGVRNVLWLDIEAWDLHRLICEANRLGREGREVTGFGYDYEGRSVALCVKVE